MSSVTTPERGKVGANVFGRSDLRRSGARNRGIHVHLRREVICGILSSLRIIT
jgi:hypothetical protein